jgi:hypothetical protein
MPAVANDSAHGASLEESPVRDRVNHVLLTRFNLPSGGKEGFIRAREGWLRDRVALFEQYCLPSVQAQLNRDFHWIVYFDPQSPAWLRERIDRQAEGSYRPIFRTSVSNTELVADLRGVVGERRPILMTTNLDNDDGIAIDFTERLQKCAVEHDRSAVFLVNGLIKSASALYLQTDPHNAFCSVLESWSSPRTCWADWHNLLGRSMATVEVGGDPAWLQVVHGANVSNRIRGRLVSPQPYLDRYPCLLDDLSEPTPSALLRDRLVERPGRFVRESARAAVKGAAMWMGGKEGLDGVKTLLAAHSRSQARPLA